MARLAGYGGTVTISTGAIAGIRAWNVDYKALVLETTAFDSAGVAAYISSITSWAGSFDGFKNSTALVVGTSYTFEFEEVAATGTKEWTGTGIVTNVKPKTDSHSLVTYAYDFQGTGALVVPTA